MAKKATPAAGTASSEKAAAPAAKAVKSAVKKATSSAPVESVVPAKPPAPAPAPKGTIGPATVTTVTAPAAVKPEPVAVKKSAAPTAPAHPTHEQISKKAFELWVLSGRQPGRDVENWKRAEAELIAAAKV